MRFELGGSGMTYEEVMKKQNQRLDHTVKFVHSVTEKPAKTRCQAQVLKG